MELDVDLDTDPHCNVRGSETLVDNKSLCSLQGIKGCKSPVTTTGRTQHLLTMRVAGMGYQTLKT